MSDNIFSTFDEEETDEWEFSVERSMSGWSWTAKPVYSLLSYSGWCFTRRGAIREAKRAAKRNKKEKNSKETWRERP